MRKIRVEIAVAALMLAPLLGYAVSLVAAALPVAADVPGALSPGRPAPSGIAGRQET